MADSGEVGGWRVGESLFTPELGQVICARVANGESLSAMETDPAMPCRQTIRNWARADGDLVLVREDVGRHNALDKLIGALHRHGLDPAAGIALVSSRASYEMATKAAGAGITVLAAISAPTALAIELARGAGLTLVGFARPGSHNVYTHPERLHA